MEVWSYCSGLTGVKQMPNVEMVGGIHIENIAPY